MKRLLFIGALLCISIVSVVLVFPLLVACASAFVAAVAALSWKSSAVRSTQMISYSVMLAFGVLTALSCVVFILQNVRILWVF